MRCLRFATKVFIWAENISLRVDISYRMHKLIIFMLHM